MREIEKSAASVDEAVEAALAELGLTEQQVHIEVVQEPKGGFLRMNPTPAVVRVRPLPLDEQPPDEDLEDQAELAADYLEGLIDVMGFEADVEINLTDTGMYVELWGPEDEDTMGVLIGRKGHTLDALQELVRGSVQRRTGERCRVIVDVEDYRKRRRTQLVRQARDLASRVQKSGRPERFEPMSAFERKIVHDTIAELGGLETASEGQEPNRRVVVSPAAGS